MTNQNKIYYDEKNDSDDYSDGMCHRWGKSPTTDYQRNTARCHFGRGTALHQLRTATTTGQHLCSRSGLFRFSPVDTGSYLLRISAIGYEPYWQQISLPPDTALGTISLFHSATNLQAVSVTAQRPLYSADGEKTFYHVEDDPSVQAGTASDALQNAPGVEVDAEGNITYRGKTAVEVC